MDASVRGLVGRGLVIEMSDVMGSGRPIKMNPLVMRTEMGRDCEVSEWSPLEACSATCGRRGVGIQRRQVTRARRGNGRECPRISRTRPCHRDVRCDGERETDQDEPIDCEVSDWEEEGGCSAPCGRGEQVWLREVLIPASNGGRACPRRFARVTRCQIKPCHADCQSQWSRWSECDADCGTGQRTRHRESRRRRTGECRLRSQRRECWAGECEDGIKIGIDRVITINWRRGSHESDESWSRSRSKSKRKGSKSKSKRRHSKSRSKRRRKGKKGILSSARGAVRGLLSRLTRRD